MRSESEFLAEYAVSHQSPTNQIVHMICVPLIFLATLGLLWLIPLGQFVPGLDPALAAWINVGSVGALPVIAFYACLSVWSLMTGLVWLAASYAIIIAMEQAGLPLLPIMAGIWLLAWAVQFWGHTIEGAKPSFADDLVFLLIGPLFVQQKFQRGR